MLKIFHNLKDTVMVLYEQLKLKTFEKATGRPRTLDNQEVITLALYKHTQGIPTKKAIWKDFGLTCTYKTFCESVDRLLPQILHGTVANYPHPPHTNPTTKCYNIVN